MKKNKKCCMNSGVSNKPDIDNDQLGENAHEKFAPDGKPNKKGKKA